MVAGVILLAILFYAVTGLLISIILTVRYVRLKRYVAMVVVWCVYIGILPLLYVLLMVGYLIFRTVGIFEV